MTNKSIAMVENVMQSPYMPKFKPDETDLSFGKIPQLSKIDLQKEFEVRYNDVDVNGHINSIKYLEHVLDLFDLDFYRSHQLKRVEIAYVAESHQGDKLNIYLQENNNEYSIRITKSNEENDIEQEVVRMLLKFVKK
jgi:acyl-ACP thioesterase